MGTDPPTTGRPRPVTLGALVLAVLWAHGMLLQSAAEWSVPAAESGQPLSFQTRMVEPARPTARVAQAARSPAALPTAQGATPPSAPSAAATPAAPGNGLSAVATRPPAQGPSEEVASPRIAPASEPAATPQPAASAPPAPPETPAVPRPAADNKAAVPAPTPAPTPTPSPAALQPPLPAATPPVVTAAGAAATPPVPPSAGAKASPESALAAPPATSSKVAAATAPASVRLKYRVEANRFPFSLGSELQWQQDGQNYQARLEFSALGQSRVQTSRGLITPSGLAPLRFSDKYRSEVAAHFNREQGKITFSANTPDIPLLPGAQDRLSVLIQLAALLAGERTAYPAGSSIAIQTIGPRDADTWLFSVEAEEVLQLPGGEQATLKLLRRPRKEFDQRVELWLAPALGYLPARVRITEANGDTLDQKWQASEALR